MPHLHLETTADLPENADVPDILQALVEVLAEVDTVDPAKIKAYHTLRSVWAVGPGHKPGFAHLTVSVVDGRTLEWRNGIADALHDVLREQFQMSLEEDDAAVTLEVREMEGATYRRA